MNRIYRLVWSEALGAYVPAAETVRGRGKRSKRKLTLAAFTCGASMAASIAQAGPTGGQVTAGSGTITESGSTTTVRQGSQNLSIDWQTFNIAPTETVDFVQPSTTAVAVNRILDPNASQILGHLNANGQVYLINPNGVIFGRGAEVNVGGLVASTLALDPSAPTSDSKNFSGSGTGSVINEGTITATNGGGVALLGNHVANGGVISAQLGTVALGAGSVATLTFSGSHLVSMRIDQSVFESLAQNGGLILADGGKVLMTAGAKNSLLASVVNNTGVIEARSLENHEGTITLLGGMTAGTVDVGGKLDASAPDGGDGGYIETSAAHVEIAGTAKVTTAARTGQNGTWLIDPHDFTIAPTGGDETGAQLSTALGSGNVTIQSSAGASGTSGNVNVDDTVSWSANTLTLNAANNININSPMNGLGTASLALQYGQGAVNANNTSVYNVNAPVNLPAGPNFSTKLGSDGNVTNFTVVTSLGAPGDATTAPSTATLQGMAASANLATNFALGANIDASATSSWNSGAGFTPIGTSGSYAGIFDGLGHTIANLTINAPNNSNLGLFGATNGATLQNIGVINASIDGHAYVGALVGNDANGYVTHDYSSGTVSGVSYVGGLVGLGNGDYITDAYSTATVSGSNTVFGTYIGGLVGQARFYGSLTDSYATGAVNAPNAEYVGGLVGHARYITVADDYATGAVTASSYGGGLVGLLDGATINNSYATGAVTASYQPGGLVATTSQAVTVTNSYWNTTTSGQTTSPGGGTGLTSAQMQTASNFSGFNFTTAPGATGNAWVMVDSDGTLNNAGNASGATFPMLASEYSTSISNAHQLQLMAMAPGANYTLAANVDASATSLAVTNGQADVWSTSAGFVPVGTSSSGFSGSFDGQGHTIANLSINQSSSSLDVGLFGLATGAIQNVGLTGGNVTGGAQVGMLAGESDGSISGSYATGTVTGTSNAVNGTGGLVGKNTGSITGSYATVAVTGVRGTGGLVGANYGSITTSYATGQVNAGNDQYTGGLVGNNEGPISNSYATGNVSGSSYVGGLVGYTQVGSAGGNISNSHATGQVTGTGQYVGGLVGVMNGTTVTGSYATGVVNGAGATQVGGLVGANENAGTISNSYSTGNVTGSADVGGLVGLLEDPQVNLLSNAFYNVDQVTINGAHQVTAGGLFNAQYVDWFSHGETLNIANYSASLPAGTGGYYNVSSVQGLEDLLGFSESNAGLNFKLTANLSLPQGFYIPYFAGSFDGAGHTLANLSLTTDNSDVALFGYLPASSTTIANIGVSGVSVAGNENVGGLVGYDKAGAAISDSYASGSITGSAYVGGLVGRLNSGGSIGNSYFSGTVTGTDYAVGGLVGGSSGTISDSYAMGGVTGTTYWTSGLVGLNYGTATNSFYDKTSNPTLTGLSNYYGSVADAAGQVQGLTTAQFLTASTFTTATTANGNVNPAWNSSTSPGGTSTWFMYAGETAPMLRSFLTPLVITGETTTKVYDGTAFAPSAGNVQYSSAPNTNDLLGTLTFSGNAPGAVHAGTYTYTPGGLYSNQQGYLISYAAGTLAITAAPLSVTGTVVGQKEYDGTTAASLAGGSLVGVVSGDAVSLVQAGTFASKNVGNGIAVTASDSLGGADAGDYSLTQPTGLTGNITPAVLTVTGTSVAPKVYNGTTAATLTGGTLSGVVSGDAVTLTQAGSFASKDVGTGIAVTAADALGGASAGDYTLIEPTGLSGSITPATVTVTGTQATKVYNGTTTADLTGGMLVGVISGDSVTLNQAGTYASAAVGTGIPVTVTDTLSGPSASDYSITEPTGLTGSITAASSTGATSGTSSTTRGAGTLSGASALALIATTTEAQLVANSYTPQFGATPQVIDASPTIEMLSGSSASDGGGGTGGDSSTSQRRKAVAVNVSMKIGATGTLKIENGGLKLPQTVVQNDE